MFPQAVMDEMWKKAVIGIPKHGPPRNTKTRPQRKSNKFAPKTQRKDWLTDEEVKTIKLKLAKGETAAAIARQHGILRVTVSEIKRGLNYTHVE